MRGATGGKPRTRCTRTFRARTTSSSTPSSGRRSCSATPAADQAVLDGVDGGFDAVGTHVEAGRFRAAIGEVMRLASTVNQYISDQAPWALVKTDQQRAATVLYISLRAVDSLKTLFTPFIPHTSQQVHELLGYDGYLAGPLEFREVDEDG